MSEWETLANEMRAIDARVAQARLQGVGAVDPWEPPADNKRAQESYLDRVHSRLRDVANAVKRARSSAEERVQDLAYEVARIASSAAGRARRLAHGLGLAVSNQLESVEASLERGAVGFGIGAAAVLLIAFLLWQRASGR